MKFGLSLAFSLISIFFAQNAEAQTVLFRHAGAKYEKYQQALKETAFRITPMEDLEKRLRTDELSGRQQQDLDESLAQAAREPQRAGEIFSALLSRFELEPRSMAVRETLLALLERLATVANTENKTRLAEEIEVYRMMDDPRDLRLHVSLVQKEIQAKLQQLRHEPGGEDVTLFWNGIRWDEQLPVKPGLRSQWIVVSSRWKARMLNGTWTEVSAQMGEGFQDWVSGSCEEPQYRDAAFVNESRREAIFADDCKTANEGLRSVQTSPLESKSPAPSPSWKPVLWTGAIAATVLFVLSASGKKIQIRR